MTKLGQGRERYKVMVVGKGMKRTFPTVQLSILVSSERLRRLTGIGFIFYACIVCIREKHKVRTEYGIKLTVFRPADHAKILALLGLYKFYDVG